MPKIKALEDKLNILFIVNPISGGKSKKLVPNLIDQYLDKNKFNPNFSFTEHLGHAKEIALEALQKNFDIIVASGGDGTINEIASVVMEHDKILGILPLGSGNGLANFLNIPKNVIKAIEVINNLNIIRVDTATLNKKRFFNVAGIGFDAHLSYVFSKNKSRGVFGYLSEGLKAISSYKAQEYLVEVDGVKYERTAFAISIANSSQYGNDVHISPTASITDGFLDVCIIKPFSLAKLPLLSYSMLSKKPDHFNMIEIIKGKHIKIFRWKEGIVHIDGEPLEMGREIEINVQPLSLKIIVP